MSRSILSLDEKKIQAWQQYLKRPLPADYVDQDVVVVKTPYLAIMTSWCTYILLPQSHVLLYGKRQLPQTQEFGIGRESVGVVQQIGMLCCFSNGNMDRLRENLAREEYLAVLESDRWLCIDYSNLNPPATAESLCQNYILAVAKRHGPVKLTTGDRILDLKKVIRAALIFDRQNAVLKA